MNTDETRTRPTIRWVVATLGVILLIGGGLRFQGLGADDRGYGVDELLNAYDGWSIRTTGATHVGAPLPVFFLTTGKGWDQRADVLGAYVMAAQSYVVGYPTAFWMRFPNALAGLGVIILTFFVIAQLFHDRRVALIAAGLVALSPTAIQWSRTGHDIVWMSLFLLLEAFFILRAPRRPLNWLWAGLVIGLGWYGCQTFRIVGPLLALLTAWYVAPRGRQQWRSIGTGAAMAALLLAPSLWFSLTHLTEAGAYIRVASIFQQPHPWIQLAEQFGGFLTTGYLFQPRYLPPLVTIMAIVGVAAVWRKRSRFGWFMVGVVAINLLPGLIMTSTEPFQYFNHGRLAGLTGFFEGLAAVGIIVAFRFVMKFKSSAGRVAALAGTVIIAASMYIGPLVYAIPNPVWFSPRMYAGFAPVVQLLNEPTYADRPVAIRQVWQNEPLFLLWATRFDPRRLVEHPLSTHDLMYYTQSAANITFGRYRFCTTCDFRAADELIVAPAGSVADGRAITTFSVTIPGRESWAVYEK